MKRYYVICVVVAAVIVGISFYSRKEPTSFFGIAETKETIINADQSVEVEKLTVTQGQKVATGDTLVILDQPELTIMINETSHKLDEYRAEHQFQTNLSQSELKKYKAEQEAKISTITAEINELEAQYAMNNKLVDQLRSIKINQREEDDSLNPILTQIRSLRKLRALVHNPPPIEILQLSNKPDAPDDPIAAQVRLYEEELKLLEKRRKELVKIAPMEGIIGMVKYRIGEKVSPFDTILTLHSAAPSYVKGYIHEDLFSRIVLGDSVSIVSFVTNSGKTTGIVIGVGSRIVEYPERLRKRIDIPIWGREVIVKVRGDNNLVLGQKVLILLSEKRTFFSKTFKTTLFPRSLSAKTNSTQNEMALFDEARNSTSDPTLTPAPHEASRMVWFCDLKKLLVILYIADAAVV